MKPRAASTAPVACRGLAAGPFCSFQSGSLPVTPVRTALGWLGFGTLSPQVFLHPHPDAEALASLLADARERLPDDATPILIDGTSETEGGPAALDRLVASCWSFEPIEASYERFIDRFSPIAHALAAQAAIDLEQAVTLRIALIHDFRRILLRDPWLPPDLLPRGWIGRQARSLVVRAVPHHPRCLRELDSTATSKVLMDHCHLPTTHSAIASLPTDASSFRGSVTSCRCEMRSTVTR